MSLPQAKERLMTGEELYRRPDLNPCELIEGKIVPMAPTSFGHGEIELNLGSALRAWAKQTGRGRVPGGEVGIYVRRDPDTVRGADLLFISHERFARRSSEGYLDVAPELIVEILSSQDRWSDMAAKLADYFSAGVERVWIVDPRARRVFAYRTPADREALEIGQFLRDEDLLPGFSLPVADLFED
jgi:Uma2 family endonuclease